MFWRRAAPAERKIPNRQSINGAARRRMCVCHWGGSSANRKLARKRRSGKRPPAPPSGSSATRKGRVDSSGEVPGHETGATEGLRVPGGRPWHQDRESYGLAEHSTRGFLSTAAKKHGLKIESTKTEAGDRVYQIKK